MEPEWTNCPVCGSEMQEWESTAVSPKRYDDLKAENARLHEALGALVDKANVMDEAIDNPAPFPARIWYALGDLRDAVTEARALLASLGGENAD